MGPGKATKMNEEMSVYFEEEVPGNGGLVCYDWDVPSSYDSSDSSLTDDVFDGYRRRHASSKSDGDAAVPQSAVSPGRHVRSPRGGRKDAMYLRRREKNNEAVRRSRNKMRQRQEESARRLSQLTEENQKLQMKADVLLKELSLLRGLFPSVDTSKASLLDEVDAMLTEAHSPQ